MERIKVDANTLVAGLGGLVVGGAACGGLAYLVLRRSFESRLDREIVAIKTHYNDRLKQALSDSLSLVPEAGAPFVGRPGLGHHLAGTGGDQDEERSTLGDDDDADSGEYGELPADVQRNPQPAIDPLEGLEDGEEDADSDGDNHDPEETDTDRTGDDLSADQAAASAVDRNIDHPYLISLGEFSESPPGWQALTLKYFAGDRIPTLVDDKNEPIPNYHKIVGKIKGKQDFGGISGDPNIRYVRNQAHETDYEIVYDPQSYAEGVLNYGRPNGGS